MNAAQIQSIVFLGLDGIARLYPAAALPVELLERLVLEAEGAGFVELPLSPEQVEQARAQAAGVAAAASSAVTSYRGRR